jgi:hypothetical protein
MTLSSWNRNEYELLSWGGCGLLLLGLRLIGDKKVLGFWIASLAELM